jgi:biopolymer transport protein ExbD
MFAKKKHTAHDFELNLTPIIDCFVTLICFLLLSSTYVALVGMEAKVPVAVPSSNVKTDNEPKFKLELNVKNNGVELISQGAGSANGKKFFPLVNKEHDFVAIHNELVRIKKERPKEFTIHFQPQVEMDFEKLVKFMDTTRNLTLQDGKILTSDERNGSQVALDVLFPDFVIAGLSAQSELTKKDKK